MDKKRRWTKQEVSALEEHIAEHTSQCDSVRDDQYWSSLLAKLEDFRDKQQSPFTPIQVKKKIRMLLKKPQTNSSQVRQDCLHGLPEGTTTKRRKTGANHVPRCHDGPLLQADADDEGLGGGKSELEDYTISMHDNGTGFRENSHEAQVLSSIMDPLQESASQGEVYQGDSSPSCSSTRSAAGRRRPRKSRNQRRHDGGSMGLWQDAMFESWQGYLAQQEILDIRPHEPPHPADVRCNLQILLEHLNTAGEALNTFLCQRWSVDYANTEYRPLLCTLTGQTAVVDIRKTLEVGRSFGPLSDKKTLLCAIIGASITTWILLGLNHSGPTAINGDSVRKLFDSFLEHECPKLVSNFRQLYQSWSISIYSESTILNHAESMTDRLLELVRPSPACNPQVYTADNEAPDLSFIERQAQYECFRTNMIETYRVALNLKVALTRCTDLIYDFKYPFIQQAYDASWMDCEGYIASETLSEEARIEVCLLPSIWSMGRSKRGRTKTLVSKAVVLL